MAVYKESMLFEMQKKLDRRSRHWLLKLGWKFDIMSTSFFLSRRSLKLGPKSSWRAWPDRVFIALARNASDATEYFHIPTGRVVEIGTQVLL